MTPAASLSLYTGAILAGALAGGALPLFARVRRSDLMLSFSAGVMLGAAFFHMLPEAVDEAGRAAVPFVLVGFLLLYLLERFVLVHVCAEPGPNARLSTEGAPLPHHAGEQEHEHEHHGRGDPDGTGCDVHTLGLAAWVGMSAHTLVDGFALGAASVQPELGLLVFLAILAHKIPNSFSLSAILLSEGYSRGKAVAMNAAFALMVPAGAGRLRAAPRDDAGAALHLARPRRERRDVPAPVALRHPPRPAPPRRLALAALGGDGGGARPHGRAHPAARTRTERARAASRRRDRVVAPAGRG